MKTEAKITIREIRAALSTDAALGHITQETADHIANLLGLDWREKQHNDRKDMDSFLADLHELFAAYDAQLLFQGSYTGHIVVDDWSYRLDFGSTTQFGEEFTALLPKMWKRHQMVDKLHFPTTASIKEVRPILEAVRHVDRKAWNYVTDKKFQEMIKPYKQPLNTEEQ